jgi:hypothetical protein
VRAREVLAKLSDWRSGRGDAQVCRPGFGAQPRGWWGVCARASAWRAAILWGVPRERPQKQTSRKKTKKPERLPNLFLPWESFLPSQVPGDGQCKLIAGWIVRAFLPLPGRCAHFILVFGVWGYRRVTPSPSWRLLVEVGYRTLILPLS